MFDSITFHSNPYFGYIATFIYFSQHPLCIFYTARCVHFTVPSIRRGALFFLRGHMYTNDSRFIKKISSLGNILKKNKTARQTPLSLAPLVWNFDSWSCQIHFWDLVQTDPFLDFLAISWYCKIGHS